MNIGFIVFGFIVGSLFSFHGIESDWIYPWWTVDPQATNLQNNGFKWWLFLTTTRRFRSTGESLIPEVVQNAIEHVVFPGVVNKETRLRVPKEIDTCDCPHFLILFRDTKYQFRGLYAYYPDTEEVFKIYGTGPKQVTEDMFEKFFKYNSGGKKITQIHTKSLTVTIEPFTIFNSLWLGKKQNSLINVPCL